MRPGVSLARNRRRGLGHVGSSRWPSLPCQGAQLQGARPRWPTSAAPAAEGPGHVFCLFFKKQTFAGRRRGMAGRRNVGVSVRGG